MKYFRAPWVNACKVAGCPGALVHDMRRSAVRTFERAGVPRSVAMCDRRTQDRIDSTGVTRLWTRRCSEKRRHASMPGSPPLRQHHRRPSLPLSVDVIDFRGTAKGERGDQTLATWAVDTHCGVYSRVTVALSRGASATGPCAAGSTAVLCVVSISSIHAASRWANHACWSFQAGALPRPTLPVYATSAGDPVSIGRFRSVVHSLSEPS